MSVAGKGQKRRQASEDEEDARRQTGTSNCRKREESGVESEEAERTRKDARTTRHVPVGMWLLQVRAYLPTLYTYLMNVKEMEGLRNLTEI
ncbi:hypothetical protein NDU88_004682 [Pleurodeles waltl]|uniref:Uncharacterized protein n=1 Tax=Pleurodeles waltl TaxID=8319 RepID=A0AAV7RLM3_PLEWA|nr:hypothetical protein NDU88_004682 [Pleurodeles waltl]